MKHKQKIRKHIKAKRQQLTSHQKNYASTAVWLQITRQQYFIKAQKIAFYMTMQGELDPMPILQTAFRLGKKIYLPIIDTSENKLRFCRYTTSMRMHKNQYGIWEPNHTPNDWIYPNALDLVFIPLVAFDKQCNRLGMGKGYYDRLFQKYQNNLKPLRIGLAYQFQKIHAVPTSERDVPLHSVVTEKKIYLSS